MFTRPLVGWPVELPHQTRRRSQMMKLPRLQPNRPEAGGLKKLAGVSSLPPWLANSLACSSSAGGVFVRTQLKVQWATKTKIKFLRCVTSPPLLGWVLVCSSGSSRLSPANKWTLSLFACASPNARRLARQPVCKLDSQQARSSVSFVWPSVSLPYQGDDQAQPLLARAH